MPIERDWFQGRQKPRKGQWVRLAGPHKKQRAKVLDSGVDTFLVEFEDGTRRRIRKPQLKSLRTD